MLRQIKFASAVLAFVLVILGFGIYNHTHFAMIMSRGNFFFQKTRDHTNIQTVALNFPDNNHVTLTTRNDLWYIKEADDYFAAFNQINVLFRLIRQTSVYRADVIDEETLADFKKDGDEFLVISTELGEVGGQVKGGVLFHFELQFALAGFLGNVVVFLLAGGREEGEAAESDNDSGQFFHNNWGLM